MLSSNQHSVFLVRWKTHIFVNCMLWLMRLSPTVVAVPFRQISIEEEKRLTKYTPAIFRGNPTRCANHEFSESPRRISTEQHSPLTRSANAHRQTCSCKNRLRHGSQKESCRLHDANSLVDAVPEPAYISSATSNTFPIHAASSKPTRVPRGS